jgi:hypothetical protein
MTTSFQHDRRPAKIAGQCQLNAEKEGEDDRVSAFYIPVSGIMLTKEEVNTFTNDPTWWSRHFNEVPGKPPELLDDPKRFSPVVGVLDKYEGASVTVHHTPTAPEEITLDACRIRKIKLEPQFGGLTEMSYTVMVVPTLDERFARLLGQADHEVEIAVASGKLSAKDRQQDLPLGQPSSEQQPTTDGNQVDKTRVLSPGQAEREAELTDELRERLRAADHDRQLEEAAQHHEKQAASADGDAPAEEPVRRTRKSAGARAH